MVSTRCIHPGILSALAHGGHGDKILLADGNFPLATRAGSAEKSIWAWNGTCPRCPRSSRP